MKRIKRAAAWLFIFLLLWTPLITSVSAAAAVPIIRNERELAFELVRAYQNGKNSYKFETSTKLDYTAVLELTSGGLSQYLQSISYYGTSRDEITLKFADEREHAQSARKAESVVKSIIKPSQTVREKYKALHDWLALNCIYDGAAKFDGQSAYSALILGKAVCAGYAKAYKLLCEKAGLPCIIVGGEAISDGKRELHAWNVISLDGQWLMVDVTWDNPIEGFFGTYVDDTYFAVTLAFISKDHILSTKDYEAYAAYLYPDRVDMAYALNALGLFKGTSDGFALLERPNRAQSAVMLTRLLGMEETALSLSAPHPFRDVPSWAAPHVGTLYGIGLVKGVSDVSFGAENMVTYEQYLTFMLRSLGYADGTDFSWQNPAPLAERIGLAPAGLTEAVRYASRGFYRGDMVTLSHQALSCTLKGTGKTLRQFLIENQVIIGGAASRVEEAA